MDSIPGWGRPLEEEMATYSSILAGKFHGQKIWQATVHGATEFHTTEHVVYTHTHTPPRDMGLNYTMPLPLLPSHCGSFFISFTCRQFSC